MMIPVFSSHFLEYLVTGTGFCISVMDCWTAVRDLVMVEILLIRSA